MKKFRFLTLIALLIFLLTVVSCKSNTEKGEKGEPGIQGVQGDKGVGILSTHIDGNYLVITYTDGTVENILLADIEYELVELDVVISSPENTDVDNLEVLKHGNLKKQIKDFLSYCVYGKYYVEKIYYNGKLVDDNTKVDESGDLYILLSDPSSTEKGQEIAKETALISNQLYKLDIYYNNIKLKEVFNLIMENYERVYYIDEYYDLVVKSNEEVKKIIDNYKETVKIGILEILDDTVLTYDNDQLKKISNNIETIFNEIDSVESYEEACEKFEGWKEKVFEGVEEKYSKDNEFISQKQTILNILEIITLYFMNNDGDYEISSDLYKLFLEKMVYINLSQNLEEINSNLENLFNGKIDKPNHNIEIHNIFLITEDLKEKSEYAYIYFKPYLDRLENLDGMEYIEELFRIELDCTYFSGAQLILIKESELLLNKYKEYSNDEVDLLLDQAHKKFIEENIFTLEVKYYTAEEIIAFNELNTKFVEILNSIVDNEDIIQIIEETKSDIYNNELLSDKDLNIIDEMLTVVKDLETLDLFKKDYEVICKIRENSKYNNYDLDLAIRKYMIDLLIEEKLNYILDEKFEDFSHFVSIVQSFDYFVDDVVDDNIILEGNNYHEYLSKKDELFILVIKKYISETLVYDFNQEEMNTFKEKIEVTKTLDELTTLILSEEFKFFSFEFKYEFLDEYSKFGQVYVQIGDLYNQGVLTEEENNIYYEINVLYTECYYYDIGFTSQTFNLEIEGVKKFNKEAHYELITKIINIVETINNILSKYA